MSRITTHVLDTALGRPAQGMRVMLEQHIEHHAWVGIAAVVTDSDGRCPDLGSVAPGLYRLLFITGEYFDRQGRTSIYPEIAVLFQCDGAAHYHLPILLSDNGYTTYRGS